MPCSQTPPTVVSVFFPHTWPARGTSRPGKLSAHLRPDSHRGATAPFLGARGGGPQGMAPSLDQHVRLAHADLAHANLLCLVQVRPAFSSGRFVGRGSTLCAKNRSWAAATLPGARSPAPADHFSTCACHRVHPVDRGGGVDGRPAGVSASSLNASVWRSLRLGCARVTPSYPLPACCVRTPWQTCPQVEPQLRAGILCK